MRATTEGTLLGGRLRYRQFQEGYRTGIEPVLLAACVPARAGQVVLEGGTGAGAGLLCLLGRVEGATGLGLEADPALAALARHNLEANALPAEIVTGDIGEVCGEADHAFANPPWFQPTSSASPDPGKSLAKRLGEDGLKPWLAGMGRAVRNGGTISFVLPAGLVGAVLAEFAAKGWGRASLLPLWPRPGREARLAIVQARRGLGGTRILPGLVLHEDGGFTPAAERVLRHGEALEL